MHSFITINAVKCNLQNNQEWQGEKIIAQYWCNIQIIDEYWYDQTFEVWLIWAANSLDSNIEYPLIQAGQSVLSLESRVWFQKFNNQST